MNLRKMIFKVTATAMVAVLLSFYLSAAAMSAVVKETKVTGAVSLGNTRKQVLTAMGKPNSPLLCDYSYTKGNAEILVVFNDNTNVVDSIIIIGRNPKYSVRGITGGNLKAEVKKVFGDPERVVEYRKSGVSCWYYPSRNVNFAFTGDKVSSFSVCKSTF
jgi:outer membrane protein assembly factor BamE (lipoprotein component of BamABCDE complex)